MCRLSIAVLAKAIHSFARIGTELFLEATSTGLTLQTINLTKTSFATISFNSDFFSSFSAKSSGDPTENQCKLALKSCLGVFRNMKQVRSGQFINSIMRLSMFFSSRLSHVKLHWTQKNAN